jgi:hypothetical protein
MYPVLPFAGGKDIYDDRTHEIWRGIVGSSGLWTV